MMRYALLRTPLPAPIHPTRLPIQMRAPVAD